MARPRPATSAESSACWRGNAVGLTSLLDRGQFLPRDAELARYMLSSCVRPSVYPSQFGVLPRRLNLGSRKQRRMIAQGL